MLAALAVVAITITACGDDDPTGPSDGANGVISDNHGHRVTLTASQIAAGNAVELYIRGDADHGHFIALTAAQVAQIGNGQRVAVTSTTDSGHQHTVTFN